MQLVRLVPLQLRSMRKGELSIRIFRVSGWRYLGSGGNGGSHPRTIPAEYITKAPWYLDTGRPSLNHQRRPEYDASGSKLDDWYDRGATSGPAAKKYRKGACENCGAMTHKKQDCLERPRKKGAKYTNQDIAADEVIQDVRGNYDAKRDRWNGYDPAEHKRILAEYNAMEEERKKMREEEVDKQTSAELRDVAKVNEVRDEDDEAFGSSDEEDANEDKYADAADAVGQKLDTKTRITVRNLRIREDTAKYLLNLDVDSAHYDPKTRSMREAPVKGEKPEDVSAVQHWHIGASSLKLMHCLSATIRW